ncbi:MAG: GNAT family N-acetyltransferase, partial [Thermoplasmataceae archaeon]
ILRNIGSHSFPYPYTVSNAIDFITRNRYEGSRPFAIDFAIMHQGKFSGIIGISDIDYEDNKGHIGYWIKGDMRGKGIATESVRLLCRYSAENLRLHRLYTKVIHFNYPSVKVLLKNGFSIEGIERDSILLEDGYHSMFLFGKILD